MPLLQIVGHEPLEVESGARLVLAIEQAGVDIGHRCGGRGRCTTCRVRFHQGEPSVMTRAEYEKLRERDLLGEVRLSCQIVVNEAMHVEPLMTVSAAGWSDAGPQPAPEVEPEASWFTIQDLRDTAR